MKRFAYLGFILFLMGCSQPIPETEEYPVPHHGFSPLPIPDNNPMYASKIALGERLFFDPLLSVDSSISCGTCHLPEKAFTDGLPKSVGVKNRVGKRNVPTLFNVAYHPYFFVEGGNPRLETQMLGPLETHEEMAFSLPELIHRLQADDTYPELFKEVFPDRDIDPYTITASIAAYQRTLLSGNSRFDDFYYFGDSSALTAEELRGWQIFSASCTGCHKGPLLTHFDFENIGLYEVYPDLARMRITRDSADEGKVKTPSLRNVALTAPYMHDGSLATLRDVVEHYNVGGKNHPNKSPLIQPLNLSDADKNALEAFLKTLTGK
ncbi:MAG: c-type cytochrome [Cryomorphaceae bacterium]|nr:c-type cytochrome [Cryomorphaceae bacterium]